MEIIKYRRKKFEWHGIEIRIADVRVPYLNTEVDMTCCVAPCGKSVGPDLGRGQSLDNLIEKCKEVFDRYERDGVNVKEILLNGDKK